MRARDRNAGDLDALRQDGVASVQAFSGRDEALERGLRFGVLREEAALPSVGSIAEDEPYEHPDARVARGELERLLRIPRLQCGVDAEWPRRERLVRVLGDPEGRPLPPEPLVERAAEAFEVAHADAGPAHRRGRLELCPRRVRMLRPRVEIELPLGLCEEAREPGRRVAVLHAATPDVMAARRGLADRDECVRVGALRGGPSSARRARPRSPRARRDRAAGDSAAGLRSPTQACPRS